MRRPGGYAQWVGETPREADTITCAHCNRVHIITKEDAGGFCRQCMKALCGPCADLGRCTPFEKKLEQAEARDRFRRAVG